MVRRVDVRSHEQLKARPYMKVLFHLGHPAHFHLFKNVIHGLVKLGHQTPILIKKKDILEDLLQESGLPYHNILPDGRKDSKLGIAIGQLKQASKLLLFCLKDRPDILVGSTPTVAQVGYFLRIPSINLSEDDANEVALFAKTTYPFSTVILSPDSCDNDKWNYKTVNYNSYHELAYLHPDHFTPDLEVIRHYLGSTDPFFVLRFSNLKAYHDTGISGIGTETTRKLINRLKPHGRVLITSEAELEPEFEEYRININPKDMHHFLAFAKIYVGDSQTMAAEAGVLGTPFIRVNDFVGRLGYLNELEHKYELGYGFKPNEIDKMFDQIDEVMKLEDSAKEWRVRKERMLKDKMDYSQYLQSFIENFKKEN